MSRNYTFLNLPTREENSKYCSHLLIGSKLSKSLWSLTLKILFSAIIIEEIKALNYVKKMWLIVINLNESERSEYQIDKKGTFLCNLNYRTTMHSDHISNSRVTTHITQYHTGSLSPRLETLQNTANHCWCISIVSGCLFTREPMNFVHRKFSKSQEI